MSKFLIIGLMILLGFMTSNVFAQSDSITNTHLQLLTLNGSTNTWIEFNPDSIIDPSTIFINYRDAFDLQANDSLLLRDIDTSDPLGFIHYRYDQYYKSYPVEGGRFIINSYNGVAISGSGTILKNINLTTIPSINAQTALDSAIAHSYYTDFVWLHDSVLLPTPFLVITADTNEYTTDVNHLKFAYRVEIMTDSPSTAITFFVSPNSPINIIKRIDEVVYTATQCKTFFNGDQEIITSDCDGGDQQLIDVRTDGPSPITIKTGLFNKNKPEAFQAEIPCKASGFWSSTFDISSSVHWAAEKSYDFYTNFVSHDAFGNPTGIGANFYAEHGLDLSFVTDHPDLSGSKANSQFHHGHRNFNIGSFNNNPIATIDIIAHEMTHYITFMTAALPAFGEGGCLNESFSDIFGIMAKFFDGIRPNYIFADEIFLGTSKELNFVRNFINPKAQLNPDTYKGTFWNGFEPHTGATVQDKWFFLLAEGGCGVNDNNACFNISGIGKEKAARIAYRNLLFHLFPNAEYKDAKLGSIQSAKELFGACSNEVVQTIAAWEAVGLTTNFINHGTTPWREEYNDSWVFNPSDPTFDVLAGYRLVQKSSSPTTEQAGVILNFIAGHEVSVQNDFHVESGADFHAKIDICASIGTNAPNKRSEPRAVSPQLQFQINPNPTSGKVIFSYMIPEDGSINIELYDLLGNKISSIISGAENSGLHQIQYNVSDLSSGAYFARLQYGNYVLTQKLIISK